MSRLSNGTRLTVKQLMRRVQEGAIMTGSEKGEIVFILRIPPIPSDMPFEFRRMQFQAWLNFAMIINKIQGQTQKVVELNLTLMQILASNLI